MGKILFLPISIAASLLGGILARKVFDRAWALIDEEDPPDPKEPDVPWWKLLVAMALEGAIMRAVRGAIDHASRAGYQRVSGSWPGEDEHPAAKQAA